MFMSSSSYSTLSNQQILDAIQKRYQEVEEWIEQIGQKQQDIEEQSKNLVIHRGWWIFSWNETNHDATQAIKKDAADIAALADKIAKATGNSSFANLADAIKACTGSITDLIDNLKVTTLAWTANNSALIIDDLKSIGKTLTVLMTAMLQQVTIQEDQDAIAELNRNGGSSREMNALIMKLINDQSKSSNILQQLDSDLTDEWKSFLDKSRDAETDKNGVNWWNRIFGDGNKRIANANEIMKSAALMEKLIGAIQAEITPEIAALMPDFMQITAMLDQIVKRITEILTERLSPEEKDKKLMQLHGEIMDLFVIVIGLLSLVQQEASKDKAKNEVEMSKATTLAAEMGTKNSIAQSERMSQNLDAARINRIIMTVFKYVMEALALITAPGVGSMFMAALIIALDASGGLDKITEAMAESIQSHKTLSKEDSKVVADCVVAGLEFIMSLGGGAALDKLLMLAMEQAVKAAISAAKIAVEQTIKSAVEQVIKSTGTALAEETAKAALETATKNMLEMAAKTAAEQAAKKVFTAFMEQNLIGMLDKVQDMGRTALKELVEQAAESAAKEAVEQATKILTHTATQVTDKITEVAIVAGNRAAANAMKMTLDDIAKVTVKESLLDGTKALERSAYSGIYAVSSTNILVDMIKSLQASEKISDENSQTLQTVMQVLQALLMLIAQLGNSGQINNLINVFRESGAISGATSAWMSKFMKVANGLQWVSNAGDFSTSLAQGEIDWNLADAKTALGKIQTVLNLIEQLVSKQIETRRKLEAKHDIAKLENDLKSNTYVAEHLNDNLSSAAQELLA
jgi:hypothetical protein